ASAALTRNVAFWRFVTPNEIRAVRRYSKGSVGRPPARLATGVSPACVLEVSVILTQFFASLRSSPFVTVRCHTP
ncbi:MAG: hypothetical protein AAFR27_13660, partial [Pseudomonadota bacterium]